MRQTGSATGLRHGRRQVLLRCLLSLVLLLTPLVSHSGAMSAGAAVIDADSAADMPCHMTDSVVTAHTSGMDDCPHCRTGNPLVPCHCCGIAVTAAIPGMEVSVYLHSIQLALRQRPSSDTLPHAHRDRLFRPPIFPA
jgi:hypothetical protein